MNKEIITNSKFENKESNQEYIFENISSETKATVDDINKDLDMAIKSGEELKTEFPNNSEIKEVVEKTKYQAEAVALSSKKNILSVLREGEWGHQLIKGAAITTFLMGMNNTALAENATNGKDINSTKIETLQEKLANNPSPESYDAEKFVKEYVHREKLNILDSEACQKLIYNGMENSERKVLILKIEQTSRKIDFISQDIERLQSKLNTFSSSSQEFKQTTDTLSERNSQKKLFENYLTEKENDQKKINQNKSIELNHSQREIIKNAPELIKAFESTKKEVLNIISSKEYLQKIKQEFKCSQEEAKKHQATRINNVQVVNYEFRSKEYLELSYSCQAYYDHSIHQIALPYDVDHEKLARLAKHELLHSATMGSNGISTVAKKLLSDESFQKNKQYYGDNNEKEYFADPTERYARLKILDMELERLGIKKIGEKLSEQQYNKMMDVFIKSMFTQDDNKDHLNTNAFDFIYFTKDGETKKDGYELYKKLFNEIASNQSDKTYQHSEWNYNEENFKA